MRLLVITLFFFSFAFESLGWGKTGHRTVGQIAELHLTEKAKQKLNLLLNAESLAMVSNWMDEIKSDSTYDHTHDWHWVTIPDGESYANCAKNPHGDIIMTIERLISELKKGGLSKSQEAEHVKMLVHLVGDIHQPLHVGGKDDQGGNKVMVQWFGEKSNLHRVWDSNMIDGQLLSYTEWTQWLMPLDSLQVKKWQQSTVLDWAEESRSYLPLAYTLPENMRLGHEYSYTAVPVIRMRLSQAGVRLAAILNEIYG
ncbi:S1/P1 nuclease [Cytophagales bacterium LB-30]|uniref:S1/P1 nuclease n=1 Tax=Shiella aurantiaca TaxID=3058365 RepID=A0ABT8F2I4_9BACT|nr:S1/P1 nuclease [Shiella aurantiaca]MDN4164569.1 S1/P1 nuclease [Shiella aurantiaca]